MVMEEIRVLEKNGTQNIRKQPKRKILVEYKWVFKIKYKDDETVERYKARLVIKGFTQTYRIDYMETFVHVAKLNTIRVLLSLTANLDLPFNSLTLKMFF